MVYWGCGTARNRCMWAVMGLSALVGSLLLAAGGAKLDICSRLQLQAVSVAVAAAGGSCDMAPVVMMVLGAFVLLGMLPSLFYFSGCAAPPPQPSCHQGVPCSGITVVRRSAGGQAAVFQYDASGRLLAAPDCVRAGGAAAGHVLPLKSAPALEALPDDTLTSGRSSGGGGASPKKQQPAGAKEQRGSSGGGAKLPRSSQQGGDAVAEVHIALSLGPLAAGRPASSPSPRLQQLQQQRGSQGGEQQQQQRQQQRGSQGGEQQT